MLATTDINEKEVVSKVKDASLRGGTTKQSFESQSRFDFEIASLRSQ